MNAIERSKYLDESEVRRLRTVVEAWAITDLAKGNRQGVLTWMVVDVALRTGLRVSEIAALKIGDLDLKRGFAKVRRAKRRKATTEQLALGDELRRHLAEFIAWKELVDEPTGPKAALFTGKRGALSAPGLQRLWHKAIERAGLPTEYSIHCARHTLAVALLRTTRNLRQVQKQLGHTDPAVTANMYADISFEEMGDGIDHLYADDK